MTCTERTQLRSTFRRKVAEGDCVHTVDDEETLQLESGMMPQ